MFCLVSFSRWKLDTSSLFERRKFRDQASCWIWYIRLICIFLLVSLRKALQLFSLGQTFQESPRDSHVNFQVYISAPSHASWVPIVLSSHRWVFSPFRISYWCTQDVVADSTHWTWLYTLQKVWSWQSAGLCFLCLLLSPLKIITGTPPNEDSQLLFLSSQESQFSIS